MCEHDVKGAGSETKANEAPRPPPKNKTNKLRNTLLLRRSCSGPRMSLKTSAS